jgi:hypothetical protein
VWHASVAPRPGVSVAGLDPLGRALLESRARDLLEGVGDAKRGEWVEVSARAIHVRRRLSADEERLVGPAIDIRGTPEVEQRLCAVRAILPKGWKE